MVCGRVQPTHCHPTYQRMLTRLLHMVLGTVLSLKLSTSSAMYSASCLRRFRKSANLRQGTTRTRSVSAAIGVWFLWFEMHVGCTA